MLERSDPTMNHRDSAVRLRLPLGFAALMAALLAACPLSAHSATAAPKADELKLNIVEASYSTPSMLTYIAAGKRYFQRQGLSVKISSGVGSSSVNALLLSGQA